MITPVPSTDADKLIGRIKLSVPDLFCSSPLHAQPRREAAVIRAEHLYNHRHWASPVNA